MATPTRDYVHVSDVVRCMLRRERHPGVFNVATERETDVLTVLGHLQAAAGTSLEPVLAPLRTGELMRSCLSTARAREVLGFTAGISLAEGLRTTYAALVEEFAQA